MNDVLSLIVAICITLLSLLGVFCLFEIKDIKETKAIIEYEKGLLRNQKCKIIGVIDNAK